jgi:alcohol dehydrogenase
MPSMRAARLHVPGGDFQIDQIPRPVPAGMDVLVQIKAAGVVPNLRNVMNNYGDRAYLTVPELPAIYGLDAAGVVVETGADVTGIQPGDRVYINPGRSCGSCEDCRRGDAINCPAYTFQGYFGFGPGSRDIYKRYPYGGFCEFATAPASGLVKLPDAVSYESASRFGYLGTAYSALRKAGIHAGSSVLINGATGTLGVGAVLLALAMGATRIFCVARKRPLLERLRAIDPQRIFIPPEDGTDLATWSRSETDGLGVDAAIDTLGPGADPQAMLNAIEALRRGGRLVNIGGMSMPMTVNMHHLMCVQKSLIGSLWFTVGEAQEMSALAAAGLLDLTVFDHQIFDLQHLNDALRLAEQRAGGFMNVVIKQ